MLALTLQVARPSMFKLLADRQIALFCFIYFSIALTIYGATFWLPSMIKKMGNLKDLMGMIPGVGKSIKDIDIKEDAFKGVEAIIQSMTLIERRNPDTLTPSRKARIAKGAGKDLAEINAFIKQFDQMKQMMKTMSGPMGAAMASKMPGMRR